MKHITKKLVALIVIGVSNIAIDSLAREQKPRKIIRSISEYPARAVEASLGLAEKAQIVAIETQIAQANELFKKGHYQEAIDNYLHAIEKQPDHPAAHYNLGLAYLAINKYDDARNAFDRTLELDNNHVLAHYFLGYVCQLQHDFTEAIEQYDQVIDRDPTHFNALLNRGRALGNLDLLDDAILSYERAIQANPSDMNANFELGYLYNRIGNLEASARYYRNAVTIDPNRVEANCNLAHALRYEGKMSDAIPFYQKVLDANPENAHAHCGLAECYLALGNFADGFYHFEYRFNRMPDTRNMVNKRWDGTTDLTGKTILVRAEYGQGDTIQFARYLPLLKKQGARVILEVQHTLVQLFSHAPYIDQVIAVNDPVQSLPDFDYQIPMMSLPAIFKTTLETIPSDIPYIHTDKQLDAHWQKELEKDTDFKIGICWEGSTYYEQFKSPYSKKSIPLALFASLTKLIGVKVYSLQKMNGTEQLNTLPSDIHIHNFGESFDNTHGRFMDTASAIKHMDLIVSTDTSIAHLAGALGKRTWVVLPYVADWRWLLNRNDSPWYPTMRLFRQTSPQNWHTVFEQVHEALEDLLFSNNPQPIQALNTPVAEVSIGELVDKMTILEIKSERIQNTTQLRNITNELTALKTVFDSYVRKDQRSKHLFGLIRELKAQNEKLWDIEDQIRAKEAKKSFDEEFIALARSVYFNNDERGRIKRAINDLLGSRLVEEKKYTAY